MCRQSAVASLDSVWYTDSGVGRTDMETQTYCICRKSAESVAGDIDIVVADLGQSKKNFKPAICQCDPYTIITRITWELFRNANPWAPPHTNWIRKMKLFIISALVFWFNSNLITTGWFIIHRVLDIHNFSWTRETYPLMTEWNPHCHCPAHSLDPPFHSSSENIRSQFQNPIGKYWEKWPMKHQNVIPKITSEKN